MKNTLVATAAALSAAMPLAVHAQSAQRMGDAELMKRVAACAQRIAPVQFGQHARQSQEAGLMLLAVPATADHPAEPAMTCSRNVMLSDDRQSLVAMTVTTTDAAGDKFSLAAKYDGTGWNTEYREYWSNGGRNYYAKFNAADHRSQATSENWADLRFRQTFKCMSEIFGQIPQTPDCPVVTLPSASTTAEPK